jgi:uncharacterized protein
MSQRFLIDTNVVVSGLLTSDPDAPTSRILDAMLGGRFRFLISIELLAEYREVLLRPKIRRRHRLSESEIDRILTDLAANGIPIESPSDKTLEGDDHLRWILESDASATLITGDTQLARSVSKRSRSPRSFAAGELAPERPG